jgi:hypothetical protein
MKIASLRGDVNREEELAPLTPACPKRQVGKGRFSILSMSPTLSRLNPRSHHRDGGRVRSERMGREVKTVERFQIFHLSDDNPLDLNGNILDNNPFAFYIFLKTI